MVVGQVAKRVFKGKFLFLSHSTIFSITKGSEELF